MTKRRENVNNLSEKKWVVRLETECIMKMEEKVDRERGEKNGKRK